ncbi:MAG: DUF2961 domain-containing protein [Sedimentisphaerales bacterium]|nr:DUF2961 domain-containing protein [Sedimentisphaerales bacterium]
MRKPCLISLTILAVILGIFGGGRCSLAIGAERLTYVDLISRLTDLEHLATLPAPGEKCAQWSSYDRRSKYDAATGNYVAWSANGDGTGIIRKEGDETVFAEIEGPAVIWRIWSALAKEGHVKIYLDGADEPAVDLSFDGYFNGQHEPFTRPALVHTTARGRNCYVPIPFQKSCKITAEGDWGRYYHFTYTTYPKGTILPTFKRELSAEENKALDAADKILRKGGPAPAGLSPEVERAETTVTIEAGERFEATLDGPRAVTAFGVNGTFDNREDEMEAMRDIVLQITWDDEGQPAVWSPLGDFFGTAPGVNLYRSFPLGMTEEGYYCNWYMPFATSTKFEFINEGDKPRTLYLWASYEPLRRPIEQLGRFHAKWHRDAFLPEDPERRAIDWTMLKTEGRGRFCGVMLHVWNPRGGWWGEGDEKFYVDGEKFPSTFGTGSEDYFGYAWCNPTLFQNCYHNQTISMNNRGHISVNRWHVSDNIPFQTSFEAAIEKYYPNEKPTLYASTVYWYQAAGQTDPYEPVPVAERKGYWGPIEIFKVKGALEGEQLKILAKTAGNARTQDMSGYGEKWSEEAHLWWTDAKPGDTLDLAVPVKKTARYRLKMQLTKAVDYGIVQLYLDGKRLGEPIDLFNRGVIPTGVLDMGMHDLEAGQHTLRVEIVGANENAVKSYMFGLDYILLEDLGSAFYLPEDPEYAILDSARDSVRFAEGTLVPFDGKLACKSSFVDQAGQIMHWHDFGDLEGPGWAANAVGGAYELYSFAKYADDKQLAKKSLLLLDHVLEDDFIDDQTGFIKGYRLATTGEFCLNYQHKNNWFCPGSMAKIAYQLLIFSDLLDNPRRDKMRQVALKNAQWIEQNVKPTSNGWFPRRCHPSGEHYPQNAYGDSDILFEKSADGLFIIQLMTELTKKNLADYSDEVRKRVKVFMDVGGIFGSINHDTYDYHEDVAYAVGFRVLRQAAKLLNDDTIMKFAYEKCLAGLDQFKMTDNRNGVQTKGLLWMEKTWDTAYLWENAEAALAYFEAYSDTQNEQYLRDGLTILRACAKHHHGDKGFLTEGVDWNNHVGKQHHFNEAEYGDIKYTEPLLNNLHIVEPTLFVIELKCQNR